MSKNANPIWLLPAEEEQQPKKPQEPKRKEHPANLSVSMNQGHRHNNDDSMSFPKRVQDSFVSSHSRREPQRTNERPVWMKEDDSINSGKSGYSPRNNYRKDQPFRKYPEKSFRRHQQSAPSQNFYTKKKYVEKGPPPKKNPTASENPYSKYLVEGPEFAEPDKLYTEKIDTVLSIKLNSTRILLTNRKALDYTHEKDFLMVPFTRDHHNLYPMEELKDFTPSQLSNYIKSRPQNSPPTIILKYPEDGKQRRAGLVLVDMSDDSEKALTQAFTQINTIHSPCKNLVIPYMFRDTNKKLLARFIECIFQFFQWTHSKIIQLTLCIHSDPLFFPCQQIFQQRMLEAIS